MRISSLLAAVAVSLLIWAALIAVAWLSLNAIDLARVSAAQTRASYPGGLSRE